MELELTTAPNLSLIIPSVSVNKFESKLEELTKYMFEYLKKYDGIGLAAPQASYNVSVVVIAKDLPLPVGTLSRAMVKNDTNSPGYVLVNPIIKPLSEEKSDLIGGEGCLSLPGGVSGKVRRYKEIELTYQNIAGDKMTEILTGVPATVVQHEVDHLNGVLYPSRMESEYDLSELLIKYCKKNKVQLDELIEFMKYSNDNINRSHNSFILPEFIAEAEKLKFDKTKIKTLVNKINEINGEI